MKINLKKKLLQDPFLLAILGTAIGLALVVVGITVFWGSGQELAEIPWYIPMVSTYSSVTGLCVAFLALGRYRVLRDPVSFWIGIGFASLCIGQVFYVLAWPGLLPNGSAIIARLTNTPTFLSNFNFTILGSFLLAAVLLNKSEKHALVGRRWLGAVAAWLFSITLIFVLFVSFEQYLPVLVRVDRTFTPLLQGWSVFLVLLFAAGSFLSIRFYLRSKDVLAGYMAFSQMALVFIVLMTIVGEKRYDLWWYIQRIIMVGAYLIVLFGLLSDYVRLLQRETEGRLMLDAMMENVPIGLAITGGAPDFRIDRVSRHGLEMNQRSAEELIGLPSGQHQAIWKFFLADGITQPLPEHMPLFRAARLGEEVMNVELVMEAQDGRKIPVLVNAAPIRDAHGQIVGAINTWLEITEIKRAELALRESEQDYSALFNARSTGVTHLRVITDEGGKPIDFIILQVNHAYETITGIKKADIEGKKATDIFPGVENGLYDYIENYGRVAHGGGELTFEAYFEYTQKWLSIYVYSPKPGEVVAIFSDISKRKRAEEALAEVARLLEHSNRELEQFAFVASHDLQEPLRKIEAFGELLLHSAAPIDDRQHDYIERMRKAAGRMRDMIDGLLQLSRVNTQGQPFVRVNLAQVAADVLSDLDYQISRTDGVVEIGELPEVTGDPLQLHQMLQNLISNALKYHFPHTPPVVRVYACQLPAHLQIVVEDNGIGFNAQDVERMFQPLQRLVGRHEYEGSGMGLAICRRIVERHNGEITAHSEPGKGSVFIVTLPSSEEMTVDI